MSRIKQRGSNSFIFYIFANKKLIEASCLIKIKTLRDVHLPSSTAYHKPWVSTALHVPF